MRANAGFLRTFGLALATLASIGSARAGDDVRLADYFGFLPLEVYKLDHRINGLLIRDFDGDKIDDIAVVNNARSRIDLLLSTPKPGEAADEALDLDKEKGKEKEVNKVSSDRRMRLLSVPVNREIVSLQAGDFDGDGKTDLVYYGNPSGIEVLYNRGAGKFGDVKKINTGEALEAPGALSVGDLDKDGRDDLALLTKEEILLIFQREKGKLGEIERLPHTLGNPRMVKIVDLDGDGVSDLAMLDGGDADPIRVRFATQKGKHGPEERFFIEPLRAYAFGQVDGKPGQELTTIEQQSGRVRVLGVGTDDDDDARRGRLSFYPLPPGGEKGRSLDLGDLDGDGKMDVVATDPERAQFIVYRQSGRSGLGESKTFPSLVGGGPVKLADLDGDGKAEVYVVSEKEKQLGRSVLQDGRLTFPVPLPISGNPVALGVADLDGDKTPEILYITSDVDGTRNEVFTLRALAREKTGTFVPYRWGPVDSVPLKGIGGVPPAITVVDVNRDGLPDMLVFDVYGPPTLLLGRPGEPPAPAAGGLGPLAGVTPAGLSVTKLDGQQALIVAQQTFARKLLLDKGGHWTVQDQYDSGRTSAKIEGAAVIDTDGDGVPEIALLDRISKSVLFLAKKEGTYLPSGSLSVGPFDDFKGMHVADLDGDGKEDLLLAGASRFGVVLTGQKGLKLKTLASYESPRNEARFGDLIIGDLNGDGQTDVVLTDVIEHFVEIATFGEKSDLSKAFSFKIFERKSRRTAELEPRDLAIGDVDGDGRTDLVLIAHDRVLVYRQDPGQAKEPVKAADKK
jgi:FG-GAP-like repeat